MVVVTAMVSAGLAALSLVGELLAPRPAWRPVEYASPPLAAPRDYPTAHSVRESDATMAGVRRDEMVIPVRGTELAATVFTPDRPGPHPAVALGYLRRGRGLRGHVGICGALIGLGYTRAGSATVYQAGWVVVRLLAVLAVVTAALWVRRWWTCRRRGVRLGTVQWMLTGARAGVVVLLLVSLAYWGLYAPRW